MYTELDPRHDMQPHLPRILNRDVYYSGQTIIEQGSGGHRAFYIEKGRVEVLVREGSYMVRVAELGPGEIFGEMALIENEQRSANVRALEDTTVTVISGTDLENRLNRSGDKAITALIRVLADRLRLANDGQIRQYRHLAEFQDRMTGLVEKARKGVSEKDRQAFRDEVAPLLEALDDLLARYGAR